MAGRAAYQPASELFLEQVQGDSLSCCPADGNSADLESVDTPSSDNSDNRAWHLAQAVARAPTGRDNAVHLSKPTLTPQLCLPRFLCRGNQVASLRGLVAVHPQWSLVETALFATLAPDCLPAEAQLLPQCEAGRPARSRQGWELLLSQRGSWLPW